jgi:hypothetical protein
LLRPRLRWQLGWMVHLLQFLRWWHANSIILGDYLCVMRRRSVSFFAAESVLQHTMLPCQLRRHLEWMVHMLRNLWWRRAIPDVYPNDFPLLWW